MNNFFKRIPPVVLNLFVINLIMLGVTSLIPGFGQRVENLLALHYFSSPGFNPFQLISYMFIHSGFTHFFFNMFALVMFGSVIERAMGSNRFLFYYISCGIVAAFVQLGVFAIMLSKYHQMFTPEQFDAIVREGWNAMKQGYNFTDPTLGAINALVNSPMVGASGAVYGVILAFGMLFPNQPIYLYFAVPVKAKWIVIAYAAIELFTGLGNKVDNVAHFAHLGGMIAGVILILYWKKKGVFNNHWFF